MISFDRHTPTKNQHVDTQRSGNMYRRPDASLYIKPGRPPWPVQVLARLVLPQNYHFCPQTEGKASLGALQPPLSSQAGFLIKRMTYCVGFSSTEWDLKEIQIFWSAKKPSSGLTSLQAMHPTPTRIHRCKHQQILKPLEGSSCLNFTPHVVQNRSKVPQSKYQQKECTTTALLSHHFIPLQDLLQ